MFKTDLQKKIAIAIITLFLIVCVLLLAFKVITIYILWGILFILPLLFVADICFALLPVTIPVFFSLAGYTLIKKDYEKFNKIYEYLTMSIIVGIINCEIDNMLSIKRYVLQTNGLRLYWMTYLGLFLVCGSLFISKKKDTRLYLFSYGIFLLFYLLYKVIESFE